MGVSDLRLRPAQIGEFDAVLALLGETVERLRQRGLDQWSTWPTWRTKMRPALERGDVWLLLDDGNVIGTITAERCGDPDFWTPVELAEPAVYLSKLAIRQDRTGGELGALLLRWASDHAYRQGCTWIRLDAWKANEGLHRYYRERGWQYLRTVANDARRSGALFQAPARPLGSSDRERIGEVPNVKRFDTRMAVRDDRGREGDWYPDHTHQGALTVEYEWVGQRSALFVPTMRYRVRQDDNGRWRLEGNTAGGHWDRSGAVVASEIPLESGTTYVITHDDTSPCGMVLSEVSPVFPASPNGD